MKRYIAYFKTVMRHKKFVFQECLKLNIPIFIAIFHDWDKFLPDEFIPYAKTFNNEDGSPKSIRDKSGYYAAALIKENAFDMAWLLHQKRNKHHWQWWILPLDDGGFKAMPMSELYRKEMLADWRGAGRAYGNPDTLAWYTKNKDNMQLHPQTRIWIEDQLGYGL